MPVYLRPKTLKAALGALAEAARDAARPPHERLTVIAGGTDIYPARAARQAWLEPFPRDFLDITHIQGLTGIARDGGALVIGAATSWTAIARYPLPPAFAALRQAALRIGGPQIQNRGTIGGNLVNASPAADGVPPLLSLDAEIELASPRGTRRLPLATFIRGNRRTALTPDELLTAVRVPVHRPSARSLFLKLGARSHLVISIASVALLLDAGADGAIADIRITVGACSAVPARLAALEAALRGERLGPGLLGRVAPALITGLAPIDDVRASAAYRREVAPILVRRALAQLIADAGRAEVAA